eukprot:951784-Amphidinium_carterae.1
MMLQKRHKHFGSQEHIKTKVHLVDTPALLSEYEVGKLKHPVVGWDMEAVIIDSAGDYVGI